MMERQYKVKFLGISVANTKFVLFLIGCIFAFGLGGLLAYGFACLVFYSIHYLTGWLEFTWKNAFFFGVIMWTVILTFKKEKE